MKPETYCEVVGTQIRVFSSEMTITINDGTEKRQLVTENGEPAEFTSMIAAANYMATYGWVIVGLYCEARTTDIPVYVMKKNVDAE